MPEEEILEKRTPAKIVLVVFYGDCLTLLRKLSKRRLRYQGEVERAGAEADHREGH